MSPQALGRVPETVKKWLTIKELQKQGVSLDRLRIISPEEWGVDKYSIYNIRPRPLQELSSSWGTLYKPLILNAKRIQNPSDANLSYGGKCICGASRFELGLCWDIRI